MKDKELRKLKGAEVKQRRLELNLTQLMSQKNGCYRFLQSCVMRMVRLTIRSKWLLEGLSEALHVILWNGSKGKQMNMKPILR